MDPETRTKWENFINPSVLKTRLIAASIYIAGYQSLREVIIGRIRDFFWHGFNEKGDLIDPKYQSEVLSRNQSPLYASLDWLKSMNVIDDSDIKVFESVKCLRNDLAHKLLDVASVNGLPEDLDKRFKELADLIYKIELWWVVNVEIATDPDLCSQDIDEKGILPGRLIGLQMLCDIALGSEEQSKRYQEEFQKLLKRGK